MKGCKLYCGALAVWLLVAAAAASAQPIRVAVLPVVVHTATDESDYLSKGLAQMLTARLEQAGGIDVVLVGDVSQATTDAATAVDRGGSANADFVIFGSFTQFGDGASLDMRCARVDGTDSDGKHEARQVFVQSGKLGDIIPRMGDLTSRIVYYLKGGAVASGSAAGASEPGEPSHESELERRVHALERAVFSAEPAKASGKATNEAAEE